MVVIEQFEVEQWMNRLEGTPGVLNVAETCAASVSIDELVSLCRDAKAPHPLDLTKRMTYGAITGSVALRRNIARLVSNQASAPLPDENVVVTAGAISANFLLFYSLVGPGDHVVCVYPTYQQLYTVPESLGAEVSLWTLKKENGYAPDTDELLGLLKSNTKMIVINNPNNPTGVTIPRLVLERVVGLAREMNIIVFSDEAYSPLFHSLPDKVSPPPSILSLGYERTVVTGTMSKAFALAGIRVGWVASRDKAIIESVCAARDYTTISVSQLDDQIASYALSESVISSLLARNLELARTNLSILESFIQKYSSVCSWVKPTAGTTAFVEFKSQGGPVEDAEFVLDLLDKTKVLFMPGSTCFGHGKDFRGHVRIGYACHTEVLVEALEKFGVYVEEHLLKDEAAKLL